MADRQQEQQQPLRRLPEEDVAAYPGRSVDAWLKVNALYESTT
jgi:hypothetical protein